MKIKSGREVLSMDNTDKLVDLLIDIKKEFCKKYYNGSDCQQFDSHNNLHWCLWPTMESVPLDILLHPSSVKSVT